MDYLELIRKARAGDTAVAEPESVAPKITRAVEERLCFHCAGTGRCDCIACGQYQARMEWVAGPCVPCQYRAAQKVRIQ